MVIIILMIYSFLHLSVILVISWDICGTFVLFLPRMEWNRIKTSGLWTFCIAGCFCGRAVSQREFTHTSFFAVVAIGNKRDWLKCSSLVKFIGRWPAERNFLRHVAAAPVNDSPPNCAWRASSFMDNRDLLCTLIILILKTDKGF